jgi:hypothetical protein
LLTMRGFVGCQQNGETDAENSMLRARFAVYRLRWSACASNSRC